MSKKMTLVKQGLRMRLQGLEFTKEEAIVLEQYFKKELAIRTRRSPGVIETKLERISKTLEALMQEYQLTPMEAAHLSTRFQTLLEHRTVIVDPGPEGGSHE